MKKFCGKSLLSISNTHLPILVVIVVGGDKQVRLLTPVKPLRRSNRKLALKRRPESLLKRYIIAHTLFAITGYA